MERQLPVEARALLDAIAAIGSDLDLHGVLRRIVESACSIAHAEYGVLGIIDERGEFSDLVSHGLTDVEIATIGRMPKAHGLLGMAAPGQRPVRVGHVAQHPASAGFPPGHPPIDRFLAAPVVVGARIFGRLHLGNRADGHLFTATDQALVQALARVAGVMIGNARAFEESERRRQWLEGTVRISEALAPTLRVEESLLGLVEGVRDVAAAEVVALVQCDGDRVEVAAAAGRASEVAQVVNAAVEEVRAVARTGELRAGAPGLETALVLPIHSQLTAPGVLVVSRPEGWARLRGVEQDLVGVFAEQVGLALDRAQALRERHEQLLAKDRDRIARDLHDLVVQRLYATGMQLKDASAKQDADALRRAVDLSVVELDRAIDDLRGTIFELGRDQQRTLHEEVRALVAEYAAVLGFMPLLRFSGPVDRSLAPDHADQLLLTLREALSNVARHAGAGSATVEVTATSRWLTLRVVDDGAGLDPAGVRPGGGLDNARHRAEALGGHCTVDGEPGAGTSLVWVVPTIG